MDGSTITFISRGLHISPSTHPFYCKTVSPPLLRGNLHSAYFIKLPPHLRFFKALSLLPLHSHCTSLKHRSLVILHNSEGLRVKSLMAQRWLTFRLTPVLMNSCSHHHCLSSLLKPTLCSQGLEMRGARIVN